MSKGVFTTRIGSGYDDDVELHYHFPRTYLGAVEQTVGDQIVYYEPRRSDGDMSYFATATVAGIRKDPRFSDHYYADLQGYLDFDRKVPFVERKGYYESILQKQDGSTNRGAFGRSVRLLPEDEFTAIMAAGFGALPEWPEVELPDGFHEGDQAPFLVQERAEVFLSRPFRDRMFSRVVQRAYDRRCAVTGLRLLNGGGRPEVQAAHIRSVAAQGPDSVRNGIALSGTMHWMFDRGMMTFEDDYSILLSRRGIPDQVASLVNRSGRLLVPARPTDRPSPSFLRHHRENVFKE
ncbi:MAG TPA: HNH endonuclease [Devosia sp.]|nr:HNH endonuclease [Devosia sp.]